jgi:cytochrome P450
MSWSARPLPSAKAETGLEILKELARQRSLLVALEIMHRQVGDIFQITLPGFRPAVLVGPETNRFVLVSGRDNFLWRTERDPVVDLLRHGLLVLDGEEHDALRRIMDPLLHRREVNRQVEAMRQFTDQILDQWEDGEWRDMLVEMRRVALLILMGTLFKVDFMADMDELWEPILRSIEYISPGPWILWSGMPRHGYRQHMHKLDTYLHQTILQRRLDPRGHDDLITLLVSNGLDDGLIRDQMLTMLIAGHDTSTALLAWALYLLGRHPTAMNNVRDEVDRVVGRQQPTTAHLSELTYLDRVIKETLRLYPPIHIGNRKAGRDVVVNEYGIRAGTRVMYSIYLSHRHPEHWDNPEEFCPERFGRSDRSGPPPFTYLPFGGGPRNCIGASFAQVEAKVILARILQRFDLSLADQPVRAHMGATLEPRPGVRMMVKQRRQAHV